MLKRTLALGALIMLAACADPMAPTDIEIAQQADEEEQTRTTEDRGQNGGGDALEK